MCVFGDIPLNLAEENPPPRITHIHLMVMFFRHLGKQVRKIKLLTIAVLSEDITVSGIAKRLGDNS